MESEVKNPMRTVLLFANRREDALKSVEAICNDVKAREDANHKLAFARRLMGSFLIAPYETDAEGNKHLAGDRELLLFPALKVEEFEKLKSVKNVESIHNAKWVIGDGPWKVKRRQDLIDWLLGKRDHIDGPVENDQKPESNS